MKLYENEQQKRLRQKELTEIKKSKKENAADIQTKIREQK